MENPFTQPREAKSITLTFRLTETEHAAIKQVADRRGVAIVELIREGLGLVIDAESRKPSRHKR